MKSSIAQVWITGLVITFMLIFSGYLAVTISYSSTVKLKNGVVSIIEKRYGFTANNDWSSGKATKLKSVTQKKSIFTGKNVYTGFGTFESINLYLLGSSYNTKGYCEAGKGDYEGITWYGVYELYKDDYKDGKVPGKFEKAVAGKKYYYCFAKVKTDLHIKPDGSTKSSGDLRQSAYYKIRLFYTLEIPIVNGLVFTIDGKTNAIDRPSSCEIADFKEGKGSCK